MPVGTDVYDFYPRKGTTGDDRYLPDDSAGAARIITGSQSYSSSPLYSEIQAGDGINQVIALVNFRMNLYYDSRNSGGPFTPIPYLDDGATVRIIASVFATLKTQINTIRSNEFLSAYTWSADFPTAAGGRIKKEHLMDLRKALALDYFMLQYTNGFYSSYYAVGNPPDPSGTFATISAISILTGQSLGRLGPGVRYGAERCIFGIRIPSYLPTTVQYSPLLRSLGVIQSIFEPTFDAVLEGWECSSFIDPAAAADWDDRAAQIGSIAVPGLGILSDQPFSTLYSRTYNPGSNYSFLFCSTEERTDTIPAGVPVYPNAWSAAIGGFLRHRMYL